MFDALCVLQAGQPVSLSVALFPCRNTKVTDEHMAAPGLYEGSRDSNLGLQACTVSIYMPPLLFLNSDGSKPCLGSLFENNQTLASRLERWAAGVRLC